MCHIMLRLEGREPTRENIRDYQANHLGRVHGRTLLTELMPIPKPAVSHWGYEELIPQFTSREDYYRQVKPRRLNYLRGLLAEHRPRIVIGYGKAFWPSYRKLFEGFQFSNSEPFQVATRDSTLVALTGHFTARSMNGRLDEVVEIIQAQR
jgi:hypothetical protein